MQDRREHIDILFRNGLKDLEILPPSQVWDSIGPAVLSGSRKRIYLNLAASIAILVAMASSFVILTEIVPLDMAQGTLTLNQDIRPSGTFTSSVAVESGTEEGVSLAYAEPVAYDSNGLLMEGEQFLEPYPAIVFGDNDDFNSTLSRITSTLMQDEYQGMLFPREDAGAVVFDSYTDAGELTEVHPGKTDRWLIGAGFSPSYVIKSTGGSAEVKNMIESENMMLSYSGGLSVAFSITSRLSLSTGLYYSAMGQTVENISTYAGFTPYMATKGPGDMTISTSAGNIVSTNGDLYFSDRAGKRVTTIYGSDVFDPVKEELPFQGANLLQSFDYIELPLMIRYKVIDRLVDLNLLSGVSYSLLVGNTVNVISYSGEQIYAGHTEGVNPFSIIGSMGLGLEYNLSGNLSFNLEPLVRYNMSTVGLESMAVRNPWSMGVYTGLFFRF